MTEKELGRYRGYVKKDSGFEDELVYVIADIARQLTRIANRMEEIVYIRYGEPPAVTTVASTDESEGV